MFLVLVCLALLTAANAAAENEPQTTLRSVVNGVSFQSAPATVARGGILAVTGEQLASAHTVAEGLPLPVSLEEDPTVQVLINDVAAPLFFVSPTQINAQVPWEIEPGWAEVVVRRGETDSATMLVIISDTNLNLIRHDGSSAPIAQGTPVPEDPAAAPAASSLTLELGSPGVAPSATGEVLDAAAAITAGSTISIFAAGAGATEPAIAAGAAATADESYSLVATQRAYAGGLPVSDLSVEVSTELVGIYKSTFQIPDLAGSTEVVHWVSGGNVTGGVLGPVETPEAKYIAIPDGVTSVERIDMTDINPYYVAISGSLDETEGCYSGIQLLDLRRDTTTAISDCILPSFPYATNTARFYRPFELATNSPVLAALVAPGETLESGQANELLLVDSSDGTTETITLAAAADRLQPGAGGSQELRLERPGGAGLHDIVDLSGEVTGEFEAWVILPDPLQVGELTRVVGQSGASFAGGYRVRFLGPESKDEIASSQAVLYNRTAEVVQQLAFPEGWAPIAPPRRTNASGVEIGSASLAPVSPGFAGDTTAYIVARKTDGTKDAVIAFKVTVPEESEDASDSTAEADSTQTASMTATVIEFPDGAFAANCHTNVRWQRIPLTRTLAIAATGETLSAYNDPRNSELCTGDRLVLFDTQTATAKEVSLPSTDEAPAKLDGSGMGTAGSYVYYLDGARATPLEPSQKIHVFDGVTETFSEIALPEGTGVPFNNYLTQTLSASGRLVALATGGSVRTNPRGIVQPPFPGNRGLLVIDLSEGTATNLALPEGFQRAIPGNNLLLQTGGRIFGIIPMIGRAFGVFRRPNNPGGSAVVTWDVATGTATEIALPEGGFAVAQPIVTGRGGGGGQARFVWDYHPKAASFAFGVFNQEGSLISIGIVGP